MTRYVYASITVAIKGNLYAIAFIIYEANMQVLYAAAFYCIAIMTNSLGGSSGIIHRQSMMALWTGIAFRIAGSSGAESTVDPCDISKCWPTENSLQIVKLIGQI